MLGKPRFDLQLFPCVYQHSLLESCQVGIFMWLRNYIWSPNVPFDNTINCSPLDRELLGCPVGKTIHANIQKWIYTSQSFPYLHIHKINGSNLWGNDLLLNWILNIDINLWYLKYKDE